MKPSAKWLTIALVIGWFLGAASGLLLMRLMHPGGPYDMHFGRARARFVRKLNLSPEQDTQVDAILQTNREKLDGIFTEVQPRVEAIRADTAAQIRKLLTPEQQVRFDKLRAKHEAERHQRIDDARKHGPPLL